ncbi:MAG TPA: FG-GAP-like repeat-containing protein, partial [Casimicrobiaceae bacterium]
MIAGGTCIIQASQAGNGNYNAAPNINQSFTVAKAAQTITFGTLAGKTYGNSPFTVSATASSGLAVTFSSTTTAVCTVSGGTVTLVTGGTCTIQAAQSGNGQYLAAANVSQSFAVAKANQTITFGALGGQTYGAAPFTISAIASSGLAVTFSSLTTTVCTVSGSTVTIKAGGTCTIQAAQAGNGNYNAATSVSQSFMVAKANQTITFAALASKTFGATPFTVSATASSGLAVSFSSLTASVCTMSGATVTLVAAGTCTIQAAQGGNGNYNAATNVSQSFTVGVANQTITFVAPGNQLISASPIYLTATASSGLTVSLSSLTPAVCAVSGNYATLLTGGTCTIQAAQAGNANYNAAPTVSRSLAVIGVPEFSAALTYSTGNYPEAIAVGDFNGDSIPDIAVANAFSASVSILLGNGDGTFRAGTTLQTGGEPIAVAVGDFNGDGKLDLAVADFYGNGVMIFAGNGNGTFTRLGTLNAGLAPISVAVADLNGDGMLDLAIANGTYGSTIGQTVTVALGNGDGSFSAPISYATGPSPYAVVIGDFNGDGKPDLAVVNGDNNTLSVLLGRGDGTFAPAVNYATHYYPDGLAAGDFNGDGKLDLAVVNDYSNDVSIFLGRGDGTFNLAVNIPVGSGPASVAVADLNGDARADLIIANRFDNTVVLLLGNGDGTFQAPLIYSVGGQPEAIVAKDLNGDGKPDLVVTSAANNTASVLLNSSTITPAASLSVQSGGSQSAVVGTAYATPLAVVVKDAGGNPLPGRPVTFAAPATGASGAFSGTGNVAQAASNAAGVATAPTFTANGTAGAFTVTATVPGLSATFALTNIASATQAPAFISAPPPNGTINVGYSYVVSASGTPAPTFSVPANALPTGLALNGTSGLIAGTPSASGTFSGMLAAANGILPNATQTFAIT